MSERKYDRMLGIRTTGLREWVGKTEYNRYEIKSRLVCKFLSYQ